MRAVPAQLQFDDNTFSTSPSAKITIERWLPEWVDELPQTVSGMCVGHTSLIDGDNIIRIRYKYDGTGIEYQTTSALAPVWNNTWALLSGVSSGVKPMWVSGDLHYGAMMDVVALATANTYRLFYFSSNTELRAIDLTLSGSSIVANGGVSVRTGGSYQKYILNVSAVNGGTVYVTDYKVDKDPNPNAQIIISERVRTIVYKMTYNGTLWTTATTPALYPSYNIEGGAYRDNYVVRHYDSQSSINSTNVDMLNRAADETIKRWGYRPNGGLHTHTNTNNNTTALYAGTFWNRYGMGEGTHGIHTFIEYSGGWRKLRDSGTADYASNVQLFYDGHIAGAGDIVTMARVAEPGYFKKYAVDNPADRIEEVVAMRINETGEYLTEPIRVGTLDFVGGKVLEDTIGNLYLFGYEAVRTSPPANMFSSVNDDTLDISDYVEKFRVQLTARVNAGISVSIKMPQQSSLLLDSRFSSGCILKIYIGNDPSSIPTFLLAQAHIASISPSLSLSSHNATINASFEGVFNFITLSQIEDFIPEEIIDEVVPPVGSESVMKNIAYLNGNWGIKSDASVWNNTFCAGDYELDAKNVARLSSSPWAFTNGKDLGSLYDDPSTATIENGPGKVLDMYHPQDKGTWAKDIAWVSLPANTDGMIKVSTRFGFTQDKIDNGTSIGTNVQIGVNDVYDTDINIGLIGSGTGNPEVILNKDFGAHLQRVHDNPDTIGIYGYVQMLLDPSSPNSKNLGVISALAEVAVGEERGTNSSYNQPKQWACAAGIVFHAQDIGHKYMFAWEAHIDPINASHIEDTIRVKANFDNVTYPSISEYDSRLVIIATDNAPLGDSRVDVARNEPDPNPIIVDGVEQKTDNYVASHTNAPTDAGARGHIGRAMDMMVRSVNGKIECYSRPTKTKNGTNNNWTLAFTLDSTRFGSGRIGIYGRGGIGLQWDSKWAYRDVVAQVANKVDFWDIVSSDASENYTIEDMLRFVTWKSGIRATFNDLGSATSSSSVPTMIINGSGISSAADSPIITGDALASNGYSASVYLRCVLPSSPQSYVKITFDGTSKTVRKSVFIDGVEQASTIDSYPFPSSFAQGNRFAFKISAIDNKYSVWMNGIYVGVFIEDTELGVYSAISASGANATMTARIPELYEIPKYSTFDPGQSVLSGIKKVIGNRRIKSIPRFGDGTILFTYSPAHEFAGTFENTLMQSNLAISSNVVPRVTVEGAYAKATYVSNNALRYSNNSAIVSQPNIMLTEHCYREARETVRLSLERRVQLTLAGLPRYNVEAEDSITVNVVEQGSIASGTYIVDDIQIAYNGGKKPSVTMQISTRQLGVL